MGVKFSSEHGYVEGRVDRLRGATVLLDFPSVGATENLIMAGVTAEGTTVVEDAQHILRGYELFEEKLTNLGATIADFASNRD